MHLQHFYSFTGKKLSQGDSRKNVIDFYKSKKKDKLQINLVKVLGLFLFLLCSVFMFFWNFAILQFYLFDLYAGQNLEKIEMNYILVKIGFNSIYIKGDFNLLCESEFEDVDLVLLKKNFD